MEQAEELEGYYFDSFCRMAGNYPPANRSRPPKSTLTDDEKHRLSFKRFMEMFADQPKF